jgi:hypothetical protein
MIEEYEPEREPAKEIQPHIAGWLDPGGHRQ